MNWKMKDKLIVVMFFLSPVVIWAQEAGFAGMPSDNVVHNYLAGANTYAALYSGKTETPYEKRFTNHPYFESNTFVSGTLCYNRVVYKDVLMRLDLFRNELTVVSPDKPYPIVLNNEKFDYAMLAGATILPADGDKKSEEKFLVLLHNGMYPVVRKYNVVMMEDISDLSIINSFRIQQQYAVYVAGVPNVVKNKNAVLKLFPDRRKELNEYAKRHKLNFRNQLEQSIIALVDHYESLTNAASDNYPTLQ